MKHVREEAMQLSPTLIDSKLQALADVAHVVIPVTKYMGLAGLPINAVAATVKCTSKAHHSWRTSAKP